MDKMKGKREVWEKEGKKRGVIQKIGCFASG